MTVSLTVTSPPKRTQSPLTFQAEHSEAVPRRAALAAQQPAAPGKRLPAHLPSAPAPQRPLPGRGAAASPATPGSHCPIPGFLGERWHLPLERCFTPRNQPGSSWKVRGAGGSSHCPQSPVENRAGGSPFVCLSLSIFHCRRWSSSCGQQGKKEISGFSCTVCY